MQHCVVMGIAKVISWLSKSHTFVSWFSHSSSITTFFPKPLTTFPTCFNGERRKYAGKKVNHNGVSNSQPLGHKSDMLTTEPPWRGSYMLEENSSCF